MVCFAGVITLSSLWKVCLAQCFSISMVNLIAALWLLRNLLSIFFLVMADVPCQQESPYNRWRSVLLSTAAPLPFRDLHFADIVDATLLTTLSPISLHKSVSQPITLLVCSFIMSFGSLVAHFCLGSMVVDHHACSPAHWLNPSGSFSCISYRHCAVSACKLLLFHFLFCLGLYLFILREVTKRVPF